MNRTSDVGSFVDWCAQCGEEHFVGSIAPCPICGGTIFSAVEPIPEESEEQSTSDLVRL